jgi:hypothetical protein
MRNEEASAPVHIASLNELDAVVGKFLTGETPRTHWEDSQTHFQFDSMEEAIESLHDPYFRQFAERDEPTPSVLTEVKEFRRYSTDLNAAWDVVEKLSQSLDSLHVWREDGRWSAAFGKCVAVSARSVSVAICLAALRARGVVVECDVNEIEQSRETAAGLPNAKIQSLYTR